MKNLMIRTIVAIFSIVLGLCTITACSVSTGHNGKSQEEKIVAAALVIGSHSNSRALNLNSPLIKDTVAYAIGSYGFVSVISIDGNPDLIAADNYSVPEQYRGNPQLLERLSKEKTANLLAGLSEVRANDPETDVLESLRMAVRTLASAPEGAEKVITVVDTGLSTTTGLLDFRNNILNGEPQTIADLLAEKQAIPDFSGIKVVWQQLGDVSEPQEALSPAQVLKLESIWRAIVEKTGGVFEASLTIANPGSISNDLPTVSIVSLSPDEPIMFDLMAVGNFDKPQFLSEDQVEFIGDSDQYLNSKNAASVITPIADYMKTNLTFTMLLVGTTAGDDNSKFCLDLSQRRADMVKSTLVSLGVPAGRIITAGLGSTDPWHIYNVGYDGPLAAQNRKVVLVDAKADIAKEILRLG